MAMTNQDCCQATMDVLYCWGPKRFKDVVRVVAVTSQLYNVIFHRVVVDFGVQACSQKCTGTSNHLINM